MNANSALLLTNPPKWLEDHVDFAVLSKLEQLNPDLSCPDIRLITGWVKGRLQRLLSNPSLTLTKEQAPWLENDTAPFHHWWGALLEMPATAELSPQGSPQKPNQETNQRPNSDQVIMQHDQHWAQMPVDARSYLVLPFETAPWKPLAILLEPIHYHSMYVGFKLYLANGPKESLLYLAGMSPFTVRQAQTDYWLRCVHTAATRDTTSYPIYIRPLGTLHHSQFSGYPLAVAPQGNATALSPLYEALTLNLTDQVGSWASVRRIRTAVANFARDNGFELINPQLFDYKNPMRNLIVPDYKHLTTIALSTQGYGLDKAMVYGAHRTNLKKALINHPASMELVNVTINQGPDQ